MKTIATLALVLAAFTPTRAAIKPPIVPPITICPDDACCYNLPFTTPSNCCTSASSPCGIR